MSAASQAPPTESIVNRVIVCPNCWEKFSAAGVLFVSEHNDLYGDPLLGANEHTRFLPTRFTVEGDGIDARGITCTQLACPKCHLRIPRMLLRVPPFMISVLGTPSSGKSFYLSAMTWKLREHLPQKFMVRFDDVDTSANRVLAQNEEALFLGKNPDELTALGDLIRKTELEGEQYNTVMHGSQPTRYLQPYLFYLHPQREHPNSAHSQDLSRLLVIYDNAGEHYLPGADKIDSPVTRHLAQSKLLLFLFDPTQDQRFRQACRGQTADPQFTATEKVSRQQLVLAEAADRVRKYANLRSLERYSRPLFVIVTKFDAWSNLLDGVDRTEPFIPSKSSDLHILDVPRVEEISRRLRKLLVELCPDIVNSAESFAEHVMYFPASAVGWQTEVNPANEKLSIRTRDTQPFGATVPLLYALGQFAAGLIPVPRRAKKDAST